ncbi:hypothetical protein [Mucilaginibacter paludis]|uniref:Uncharacterized protein n=1 Tax=Mucilaginibacter paludis DSM 18603 TaxID=714943 RepID=H1YEE9_9SPHI|nr:hypothetical protein [Mucilaginibacter paludis]EHQ27183.1 hypothetical protein Mucpa_3079 [Mucilaginibacter paludis DSM 18603]
MNKISKIEFAILIMIIAIIFISEYYYIILKDHDRALFIGLWPPTMVGLLIYFNLKKTS